MPRISWNGVIFLDVILVRGPTSISGRFAQFLIGMRPGLDGAGIEMAVAMGLGVWIRKIKLKTVAGGSKLNKNGWGDKARMGEIIRKKKSWMIKSRRYGIYLAHAHTLCQVRLIC